MSFQPVVKTRAPLLACAVVLIASRHVLPGADFRPPSTPLIACDPYFSIWSNSDELYGSETAHWTGKTHRLHAMIRVDGKPYRLMGAEPASVSALPQTSIEVLPTRTVYRFAGANVDVTLTFMTPALPADVLILSRPVTYVTCDVASSDGGAHAIEFYLDAGGELTTNLGTQEVEGKHESFAGAESLRLGSVSQQVLGKSGDDIRIDWGYLYVAAPSVFHPHMHFGRTSHTQSAFVDHGTAAETQDVAFPAAASEIVASVALPYGDVGEQSVSRYLILAYDDLYSIEFMRKHLRPYWRKDGWEAKDLIEASVREYGSLQQQCRDFDTELMNDLTKAGGAEYAQIAALAYRQCFAAGKFVADENGQPLQFCKENHSNGCIATSDVFYPMAPQFLLFGPTLTKSFIVPFMEYAASDRWQFPFAPHDLGTYPRANGQVYGGGERSEENQMPVEECGNLLALFGALSQMEGNADFAALYWKQLSRWADYLRDKGFDPDNQLCTDDFAGHMAHNVNLSAKAICGLGAYAKMCRLRGLDDQAEKYDAIARKYAQQWVAAAQDGDHYRLAFDRAGTWSQKYNLVWDPILDLGLFPQDVATTEMAYYRKIQNEFGLPLDNRSDYTKLDWILWTATLTENQADFEAIVSPVYRFLQQTPDRSPMTDWYFTSTAKKRGFTARPVVGGVFLRMLYDDQQWTKYAKRDVTKASGWAEMPIPPETKSLVPTSQDNEIRWRYVTDEPAGDWYAAGYDDSSWKVGVGGFGTRGTPSASIGTRWNSSDIWIRRSFELAEVPKRVGLRMHHDEDATVYVNGQEVKQVYGWTTTYESFEIPADVLHAGKNTIAIHCHQTSGGQYIDAGLDAIVPAQKQ